MAHQRCRSGGCTIRLASTFVRETVRLWSAVPRAESLVECGYCPRVLGTPSHDLSLSRSARVVAHADMMYDRRVRVIEHAARIDEIVAAPPQDTRRRSLGLRCREGAQRHNPGTAKERVIALLKGVDALRQLAAVDIATPIAVVQLVVGDKTTTATTLLLEHLTKALRKHGITPAGVLTDNGPEFVGEAFHNRMAELGLDHHRTPHPGRRTTTRSARGSTALGLENFTGPLPPRPLRGLSVFERGGADFMLLVSALG